MKKTLGGDRLGAGKKQQVELHGYERSTHDLGYIWRSTMAAGTLVPFMSEIALPGDTFDIDLDANIMTHPTVGPLFGSYKVQLDVFQAPIRLYNSLLHNNALGIGLNISKVKFPVLRFSVPQTTSTERHGDLDNLQVNPSSILAYLGIRGLGINLDVDAHLRNFNGIPFLAYWEIYKNYYANKQEEIGAVIHTELPTITGDVTTIEVSDGANSTVIGEWPDRIDTNLQSNNQFFINYGVAPNPEQIMLHVFNGYEFVWVKATEIVWGTWNDTGVVLTGYYNSSLGPNTRIDAWRFVTAEDLAQGAPTVTTFPLTNIDDMRKAVLAWQSEVAPFNIEDPTIYPYEWIMTESRKYSQEGLAIKTYQSDLFNNWLQTEWIDGSGGISEVTAIDTSGGEFTIDTLVLAKKVYNMLNRIAVSGGTYDDWLDAVYTHDRYTRAESPIYCGGLSKELVFQEVVSNSQSEDQPLGTLAGKGVLSKKHKGGHVTVKVDEPSYIIGIVSLTPRVDYSQGNKWDVHLQTMDDLHKPALDEIGFQELITEQMAWWDTQWNDTTVTWEQKSAGKQPAWINYMTNYNRTYGNFAVANNEMFMTLNRRYEFDIDNGTIKDLTTYIDPSKFNFIFAETALDAQNFWTQIAVDITARRKMSAKVMPNL